MCKINRTFVCFQYALFIATTVTTTAIVSSSSKAFEIGSSSNSPEIVFSSPNVLSGIKGVSFTLPSTGETKIYNVTLKEGNIFDVYGNPPKFDVFNSIDAKTAMEKSAQGINFYLANVSQNISFGSLGTDIFYIPYAIDPLTQNVSRWSSGVKIDDDKNASIQIEQVDFIADIPVVYATIQEVPEPLTMLGSAVALGFGGLFQRKKSKNKAE